MKVFITVGNLQFSNFLCSTKNLPFSTKTIDMFLQKVVALDDSRTSLAKITTKQCLKLEIDSIHF